jgi:hypothetical protein
MVNNEDEFEVQTTVKDTPRLECGPAFSNKWNDDKLHLNLNYQFNKLSTDAAVPPVNIFYPTRFIM